MFAELLFITGLGLIGYAFYKWATQNHQYFFKRGVPHMKPNFLVGNTGAFFFNLYSAPEYVLHLYRQFPNERIFGIFDFRNPMYVVRDPEAIKQMAVKDFDHFEDHRSFIEASNDKLFGNSLFMLRGSKWRDMRATLSPAFTGSKMRQMFELVSECADDMSTYLLKQASNGEKVRYEMKELFSRYTNDVIASCAFGYKVDSMENPGNEFFQAGARLGFQRPMAALRLLLIRTIPAVMRALRIEFIEEKVGTFFKSMVLDTMDAREKQNIFRPDMVNLLMSVRRGVDQPLANTDETADDGFATVEESHIGKTAVKRDWTDDEIVAQCFLFFAAGFDTASTLLTFATYELALNQDIQQKLYDEIKETNENSASSSKSITYDALQKMKYMDQVICETLRKWPPAALTDRLCVQDYKYDDGEKLRFTMEKGHAFWIPIYGIHHDAAYYPDPEEFDPDRFSDENKNSIQAGTYIPFGIGPRNCIGSRFALMELKAIIYYLILNFNLVPNEKTEIPVQLKKTPITIACKNGMHLSFEARKK